MGLKCSLLGHAFDERDVVQERESTGSQVVTVAKDVERCSRCGSTRIVSTNKEVVSATNATADGGIDAESSIRTPGGGQGAGGPDTAPTGGLDGGAAGGSPAQGTAQAPGQEQPAGDGTRATESPNGGGRRADGASGNGAAPAGGDAEAASTEAETSAASTGAATGGADGALGGMVDRSDEAPADGGVNEAPPSAAGETHGPQPTGETHGPEPATSATEGDEPPTSDRAVSLEADEAAAPELDPAGGPEADAGLGSESDPSSEDAEILGTAETSDRAPGRWPGDEAAEPWEPAPLDGDEEDAEASPEAVDEDDTTEAPAEPAGDDDSATEEPTDEDAEILGADAGAESTGSTPDTVAEPAPEVDDSPEPAATATFTVPSGQYRCPDCGHRIDADSSFRVGDACPECVQGFLTADD